jgi:hypothetical protein
MRPIKDAFKSKVGLKDSIECKSGGNPKCKSIQHYYVAGNAKP